MSKWNDFYASLLRNDDSSRIITNKQWYCAAKRGSSMYMYVFVGKRQFISIQEAKACLWLRLATIQVLSYGVPTGRKKFDPFAVVRYIIIYNNNIKTCRDHWSYFYFLHDFDKSILLIVLTPRNILYASCSAISNKFSSSRFPVFPRAVVFTLRLLKIDLFSAMCAQNHQHNCHLLLSAEHTFNGFIQFLLSANYPHSYHCIYI